MAIRGDYCAKHGQWGIAVGKEREKRCRKCSAESTAKWRAAARSKCHPERQRVLASGECKQCYFANRPDLRAKHTERSRWRTIRVQYGLSRAEYEALHAQQNGLCAVCQKPQAPSKRGVPRQLCVDHDHATGRVRQLLCVICNIVVGHEENSPGTLAAAIQYLRRHSEKAA